MLCRMGLQSRSRQTTTGKRRRDMYEEPEATDSQEDQQESGSNTSDIPSPPKRRKRTLRPSESDTEETRMQPPGRKITQKKDARISEITELLKTTEDEYQISGSPHQELVLSFSVNWTFIEREGISARGKGSNVIPAGEKDRLQQLIFRGCIRGLEDPKFKHLQEVECGIQLDRTVKKHTGPNEMTEGTGLSVPVQTYKKLMQKFEEICVERLKTFLNNTWKPYRNATCAVDPKDRTRGTYYQKPYKWLETAVVKNLQAYEAGTLHSAGPPPEELLTHNRVSIARYDDPRDVFNFLQNSLDISFAPRDELPEWMSRKVEDDIKEEIIQNAIKDANLDIAEETRLEHNPAQKDLLYDSAIKDSKDAVARRIKAAVHTEKEAHVHRFKEHIPALLEMVWSRITTYAAENQIPEDNLPWYKDLRLEMVAQNGIDFTEPDLQEPKGPRPPSAGAGAMHKILQQNISQRAIAHPVTTSSERNGSIPGWTSNASQSRISSNTFATEVIQFHGHADKPSSLGSAHQREIQDVISKVIQENIDLDSQALDSIDSRLVSDFATQESRSNFGRDKDHDAAVGIRQPWRKRMQDEESTFSALQELQQTREFMDPGQR